MRRTHLVKVLVAILLVVGLLGPSTATALSSTTIKLWIGNASMSVNGVQQPIDTQGTKPVIVAGRTLVPIRAVIEAFGGSAAWESSTRKATVMLGNDSLDLWIGKSQASLNGTALAIDSANPAVVPVITNGRTMLPLRFVAESLGINVQYDATTKMISLTNFIPEIVTPKAMSADDLIQFLTTNFSTCDTSLGPTSFTFNVVENTTIEWPFDYDIDVEFDPFFFNDLQYGNKITTEMNHKVCGELKQFQEKIAKAAIAAMPGKKLYGGYSKTWYDYPTIQVGFHVVDYYSWVNYSPPSILTNYDNAKITGFSWWADTDGTWWR